MIIILIVMNIVSFLFSPQMITMFFYLDRSNKRLFYSIKYFGILRINSGYITIDKKYFIIHYSDKSALAVKIKSVTSRKFKDIKTMSLFEFTEIKGTAEIGIKNDPDKFFFAAALNVVNSAAYGIVKTKKPFINMKNNIVLNENSEDDRIFLKISAIFNIFVILGIFTTKLWGKIVYGKRKK